MAYEHQYPLHLHRDDDQPGKVVHSAAEAAEAFRQGFKLWTPAGLVNPLDATPVLEPAEEPADAEPDKPRKKR